MNNEEDSIYKQYKAAERERALELYKTALTKAKFINDLKKKGLGEKIKTNPNNVFVIKKTFGEKIKSFLRKIFTKL